MVVLVSISCKVVFFAYFFIFVANSNAGEITEYVIDEIVEIYSGTYRHATPECPLCWLSVQIGWQS